MKKIIFTFIILISTIFFIDNVDAKTVSYVYDDIEYNFDIDTLAQTYGHEATGNYVLTAGGSYFTSNADIKNFYIVIEIKDSILTLEPNDSDVGTNNIINNTIWFANVSSTTYSESDSSTLSVKYNLESKEFSINKNGVGGTGFSGILKTNMPYFYGRTNGELVNNKRYTLLKNLIYNYDSLEYITYNFENGERFIFPKLKDYYFLSSTSYDKYTVTYSDSPAIYDTTSNSIIYSDEALNINYTNNSDLSYEAYNISYFNSVSYNDDYLYSNYDIYDENGNIVDLKNFIKLKNMFNSGTNAYGMSKIIWNINASSDISAKDGIINFKLQYGANDFTNKNIPIFNSYKIYGYNEFESGWTDITNDERFHFDDFVYEYYTLEGTATETLLTSMLNIPSDICIYQQIKVEFYFDNTNNFYMYVFDDLDNSTWEDMQYYFENYIYYEFPSDMKYAFITHKENNRNVGKVYVPYNDIINPNSLFGAYIYDTKYKSVSRKLQESEFPEHNYYYYYDFDFSFDNNEVLLLQRKTGTDEKVSFYLSSDFIVKFANDDENITILTPNGYIDIDSGKVENVFSNDSKTFVDYLNIVRNYITSIGFYITNFFGVITYFLNSLPGEALTAIITIFIVLCACVIIKLIRK